MVEDASETEEERSQIIANESANGILKEATIQMSAREILDSCRGNASALTIPIKTRIKK